MQKTLVVLKPDVMQAGLYHNIIKDIFELNAKYYKPEEQVIDNPLAQDEYLEGTLEDINPRQMTHEDNVMMVDYDLFYLSKEQADELYADNRGKVHHERNINFISSGPVIAFVLMGHDIINKIRSLVGATDPKQAVKGTLRNKYGGELPKNAVHCSENSKAAEREINLLFGWKNLV